MDLHDDGDDNDDGDDDDDYFIIIWGFSGST